MKTQQGKKHHLTELIERHERSTCRTANGRDLERFDTFSSLIARAEELIKEIEFAIPDASIPVSVDERMAALRLTIADARQQL